MIAQEHQDRGQALPKDTTEIVHAYRDSARVSPGGAGARFVRRRQTGSHERWTHGDGRAVTIPLHGGLEIGPPLFFKILVNSMCPWKNSIDCAESLVPA